MAVCLRFFIVCFLLVCSCSNSTILDSKDDSSIVDPDKQSTDILPIDTVAADSQASTVDTVAADSQVNTVDTVVVDSQVNTVDTAVVDSQVNTVDTVVVDSQVNTVDTVVVDSQTTTRDTTSGLSLDDTEYPYAGIPRIVIETENFRAIEDRETEIPAKLQIWGEKAPESNVMDLTIRGRGNTSWKMPQKSYKIEFVKKQALLGMPKDKDWALISNYADKTLMKNYLMLHLSSKLGAFYAPRCEFAELYLNKEYLGVYLLSETIKVGTNRVNIPKDNNSYIAEVAHNHKQNDQMVYSHAIQTNSTGKPIHIHYPKNASNETLSAIRDDIEEFETYLTSIKENEDNNIAQWLDISECVKHYWVQEFSKNPDAAGYSSLYMVRVMGSPVIMGPVWDFDLAFGSHSNESNNEPEEWIIKNGYRHFYIFKDSIAKQSRLDFWNENRDIIARTTDVADSVRAFLQDAAKNNFKRWDILKSTQYVYHRHAYDTYEDAVDGLKDWIRKRIQWIDENIKQ